MSYIFYNSDLVEIPITETERGLGFVNNFLLLVIGYNTFENLVQIEKEVIPRIINWARGSGAKFEKFKIELIHFTRHTLKNPRPCRAILFETTYIAPQNFLKLLSVTLDQQLQIKNHLTNSIAKAI